MTFVYLAPSTCLKVCTVLACSGSNEKIHSYGTEILIGTHKRLDDDVQDTTLIHEIKLSTFYDRGICGLIRRLLRVYDSSRT